MSTNKKKRKLKILEPRIFAFLIAAGITLAILLISHFTILIKRLDLNILDLQFTLKQIIGSEKLQIGATSHTRNLRVNPDIQIIGIDFKALERIGKWPFPRWRHANMLKSLSRITDQSQRERSVLLDLFFIEPDSEASHDILLVDAIKENGRVFLESILDEYPHPEEVQREMEARQNILYKQYGEIKKIKGNWEDMYAYYGLQPPLQPYSRACEGYGHPNYQEDLDGTYRRQPLVAKSSTLLQIMRFDEIGTHTQLNTENFERLCWIDKEGRHHNIPYPLTADNLSILKKAMKEKAPLMSADTNGDGKIDEEFHIVYKYKDHFVPAITLALALDYFNKTIEDIEVVLGKHILIPSPQNFNLESGKWENYRIMTALPQFDKEGKLIAKAEYKAVPEIKIPIDDQGKMLINFMGPPSSARIDGYQTFPVRTYYGYATNPPGIGKENWRRSRGVSNKILLVGAFARGMASDEKTSPFGLMYGIEMHANALNTILMNDFLRSIPFWLEIAIVIILVFIIAFLTSRVSPIISAIIMLVIEVGGFLLITILFDKNSIIIDYPTPALAVFFTFIFIVLYRVMWERSEKNQVRDMFGTYLSPAVVDQILSSPPELGGVDRNLSVFFSDIRGFTTLSETMPPQELVNLLNKYLTAMTDIILDTGGTLDKYEGDAIMAFWGAPIEQNDHALRACASAIRQMEELENLNRTLPENKQINIGIGINSGIMTVGNMGSIQRMDYTVMGDNVNLGARLEGTNKQYKTNIIISEYTYSQVKGKVTVRELDNIRVKGKHKPVLIYELIDVENRYEGMGHDSEEKE